MTLNEHFMVFRDTDFNNSSGSAYLAGSPIYALGASVTINGTNNIQDGEQGTKSYIDSTDNNNVGSTLRRLMKKTSAFGINTINLTIGGGWSYDSVGSYNASGSYILTPTKLMGMVISKRPFYVYDSYLIPSLIDGDTGLESLNNNNNFTGSAHSIGSAYFSKFGIPIDIRTWNMNQSRGQMYHITWQITGNIDNGSFNWDE